MRRARDVAIDAVAAMHGGSSEDIAALDGNPHGATAALVTKVEVLISRHIEDVILASVRETRKKGGKA